MQIDECIKNSSIKMTDVIYILNASMKMFCEPTSEITYKQNEFFEAFVLFLT